MRHPLSATHPWHAAPASQHAAPASQHVAPPPDFITAHTLHQARTREVHLLGGAVLPVWAPLRDVIGSNSRQQRSLQVRRCNVDGNPIIGVALTPENVRKLTLRLERMAGGDAETIKMATRQVRETRRRITQCTTQCTTRHIA